MSKKHILCFGDSNTWGYRAEDSSRFSDEIRWPRRLARMLGEEWLLAEAGLNGRTTVFDDPLTEGLSGLRHLLPVMGAHAPLDIMVVMLGTNDCKQRFGATAGNIALGLRRLLLKAKAAEFWAGRPRILVVAPMVIDRMIYQTGAADGMGAGAAEKSERLPKLFEEVARELGCEYLDSNQYVSGSEADWMHLSEASQQPLAQAVYDAVCRVVP